MAYSYYAHTSDTDDESTWQPLEDHLLNVAAMAACFLLPIGLEECGRYGGLFHDLGKATQPFQDRLHGSRQPFDHSPAGAQLVLEKLPGTALATCVVPAICGHHRGMGDAGRQGENDRLAPLAVQLAKSGGPVDPGFAGSLPAAPGAEGIDSAVLEAHASLASKMASNERRNPLSYLLYLATRFTYSALVDADWLDTERFVRPEVAAARDFERPAMDELKRRFNGYMERKLSGVDDSSVSRARARVLSDCRAGADAPVGLFSLEVPTGGGKTLSSMAFALDHALRNGLERIVYAIPFTSIVEQTAREMRAIFGDEAVLEHHSAVDVDPEDDSRRRLLVQNWDAPIVVTTNVQLFESLFSNRPARSRKVHSMANAVIVLDEVQTLPDGLLTATLGMLECLGVLGHTSTVLASATQPGLSTLWPFGSRPVQITDPDPLREVLDCRVRYETDSIGADALPLEELVEELAGYDQVLCVVNTKKAARVLFRSLTAQSGGAYHLSTAMTPDHRAEVLGEVRGRLSRGEPCCVVSTQLVEAGVDIDFPVVFRELTGIDSIVQAAGRCNREGRLGAHGGRVVVFECEEFVEDGGGAHGSFPQSPWMRTLKGYGRSIIEDRGPSAMDDAGVQEYFQKRHHNSELLDHGHEGVEVFREITSGKAWQRRIPSLPYAADHSTIARGYRMIDDRDEEIVFVPRGSEGESLLAEVESDPFAPGLFQRVQRESVSISRFKKEEYEPYVRAVGPWLVLDNGAGVSGLYDAQVGLLGPGDVEMPVFID